MLTAMEVPTIEGRIIAPSGHKDVPGTSPRRPFGTKGRPKRTSLGRPWDQKSEVDPVPYLVLWEIEVKGCVVGDCEESYPAGVSCHGHLSSVLEVAWLVDMMDHLMKLMVLLMLMSVLL